MQKITLQRIWEAANRSVEQKVSPVVRQAQSIRVAHLSGDLEAHDRRLETLAAMMVKNYRALQEAMPDLPRAVPNVLTELMAARIIAETGPLSDFQSSRHQQASTPIAFTLHDEGNARRQRQPPAFKMSQVSATTTQAKKDNEALRSR